MKALLRIGSLVYFFLLTYIFFLSNRRPAPSIQRHNHLVFLEPFKYKIQYFNSAIEHTRKEQWYFYTDLFGNILIFIPIVPILFFVFAVRGFAKAFWFTIAISFFVELTQFILNIGVTDVDDLILNSIGAILGLLFTKQLQKWKFVPFERFGLRRY